MLNGFASEEHIKRERAKGKELRASQWWKQQLGQGVCHHCGGRFAKAVLTMDHLVPIARGGKSTKSNCVVSCKDCNSKKGHKLDVEMTIEEMRARGDLAEAASAVLASEDVQIKEERPLTDERDRARRQRKFGNTPGDASDDGSEHE